MITKQPRYGKEGYYDLKIIDKNGNSFIMTVAGNLDLFWLPQNYKKCTSFEIDKTDQLTFGVFEQLFTAVKQNDDKYQPVLKDNTITYISEDWHPDEANILKIQKQEDAFQIDFIKNQNQSAWTYPHIGCSICFCNSGSNVPEVESIFMNMFNYLAYQSSLIQVENLEDSQNM
ncbi:MAG: hypothetical protein IJD48_02160 [Clostridia bacterium]|nr:hypothetical protein [Clostridia bacterium]